MDHPIWSSTYSVGCNFDFEVLFLSLLVSFIFFAFILLFWPSSAFLCSPAAYMCVCVCVCVIWIEIEVCVIVLIKKNAHFSLYITPYIELQLYGQLGVGVGSSLPPCKHGVEVENVQVWKSRDISSIFDFVSDNVYVSVWSLWLLGVELVSNVLWGWV